MELNDLKNSMLKVVSSTINGYSDKYKHQYAELLLTQMLGDEFRTSNLKSTFHITCNDLIILHDTREVINSLEFKIATDEPLSEYGVYCDRNTMFIGKDELNKDINRLTFVSLFELFTSFQDMFASGDKVKTNAIYAVQCLSIIYNLKDMLDESIMRIVNSSIVVVSFIKGIKKILTNNDVIYLPTKEQLKDRMNKVLLPNYGTVLYQYEEDGYKGILFDLKLFHRYDIINKHHVMAMFFKGTDKIDIEKVPSPICANVLSKQIQVESEYRTKEFVEGELIAEAEKLL